ncbi:hypothetical protein ANANG_G00241260 [Anguilla anguilla]|uniref:Contactin-5 n=1 Tax=Anguilla anguilla TaxID=7936 RepID=A0A9D3RP81_ANGAN|nr:hypothetical protein ANANG_G00241260 [Anguilla anguilla]
MICEARGNPSPTYRWMFNGTELDVGSDFRYTQIEGSLVIAEPSEGRDLGQYQCKATNLFGSVLSRDALLQFAYLGNFSSRARGRVRARGTGRRSHVLLPAHSPEITYGWVFNEFPSFVVEDSRRFVSQETGNLYISKVQPSDVGSYICLVKNPVTNARVLSPPTPLTLKTDGVMGEYEPKIEVHFPPTVMAAKGVTVRLECFALGNPVPTITWRKLNGNIPKRPGCPGKSQAVLEIPNVQLEDSGRSTSARPRTPGATGPASGPAAGLHCRSTVSVGVLGGQLQVYTFPQWISVINDTQLDSEEQLQWECKATGKPRPTYRWLRDGAPLSPEARMEFVNGLMSIRRVGIADSGMYQCIAENKYGAIYSNAELKVLASAPAFPPSPVRVIATVGKEVSLECRPSASPKPTVTWKRGDRRILPSKRILLLNNTLRILNSSRGDEGNYVCQAINMFGFAEMTTTLWVKEPMSVELSPARVEVTVGESVVLSCKARHDPSLDVRFQWLLNQQPLSFNQEAAILSTSKHSPPRPT